MSKVSVENKIHETEDGLMKNTIEDTSSEEQHSITESTDSDTNKSLKIDEININHSQTTSEIIENGNNLVHKEDNIDVKERNCKQSEEIKTNNEKELTTKEEQEGSKENSDEDWEKTPDSQSILEEIKLQEKIDPNLPLGNLNKPSLAISENSVETILLASQLEAINFELLKDPKTAKFPSSSPLSDEIDWNWWEKFLREYDTMMAKQKKKVTQNIRKGIPKQLRGIVWLQLTQAKSLELELKYFELLKNSSPFEKLIRGDITRTFPQNEYFRKGNGQESLFNVMKAYSRYDNEVGYCQGLAFVAGVFLMHVHFFYY